MTLQDTDWHRLRERISGELILPDSSAYESAFPPAMARFRDIRPCGLVMCAGKEDVAEAISLARRSGIETAIRSGGHSFAGYTTTAGIVIDVSLMNSVTVSDGVAAVGAGARLADVYDELDRSDLTIPAGCGPFGGDLRTHSGRGYWDSRAKA
ncbi:MAG: FAD-binding protein, partial [Acidimicrobiia bacterium]|nr:FAD-binding protein [Acidimicrobiia bacterium]